jgi:two-component system invasion response regulator UvrY
MHPEEQYAVRAIRAGASGYLSKESKSDLLLPAMRKLAAGGLFISPKVAELLAFEHRSQKSVYPRTTLSDRKFDSFRSIVNGVSMTEIADNLCLSIKTVSTHKTHILSKLHLSSQVGLVRYAIERKLLELGAE